MGLNSILLVDDNEDDNYIHSQVIRRSGVLAPDGGILTCGDGAEALALFTNWDDSKARHGDKFPPALVLLDINMPIMDGWEFLDRYQALTKDPRYTSVVIAMLTSSQSSPDQRRADDFDIVAGYVVKPLDPDKLADLVALVTSE